MKRTLFLLIAGAMLTSCNSKTTYPKTKKVDVVDDYFGTQVADPYRWLEDDRSEETQAWVKKQNQVTQTYLEQIPFRKALLNRITELSNYEKVSAPFKRHGKYYFYKNDGLQNQDVLYVQNNLSDKARIFLDPNKLSDDGTVALTGISFSKDGKHLAYTISRSGSDWTEIFVMNAETQELLDDHIVWAKFTGASWCGDGFYYSAYDAPDEGAEYSSKNENHRIYYHKLGTNQVDDQLIFENPEHPLRFYSASVSDNENLLFIYESGAGRGNALFMKDLTQKDSPILELATDFEYTYYPIEVIDDKIYILTNFQAPNYRIMVADQTNPTLGQWEELIGNSESVIADVAIISNKLVINYDKDASSYPVLFSLSGEKIQEVKLPSVGKASFSGKKDEEECFMTFTSFTTPSTVYSYDIVNNSYEPYNTPEVNFNPEEYESYQVFFKSKDGTQIPVFLTHKKGIKKDGTNPVYLYGYGGFNISLSPSFVPSRIPFLENGGIYAQVTLRGGGEYGEEWHIAGTQLNKQNVFDDFIGAAAYLIETQYTSPKKIAIVGGSNGGLLVGACMNQRPELFGVAIPQVGVMDMLRYHKFTIGWNWASDYGTSEDSKEMFEYLYAYSPLHNLKPNTSYPATMITTADHDDRVVPAHSFKYAARLQECSDGTNPTLIRIDSDAGHGAGKPMSKRLEEQADTYGFIMYYLSMNPTF